VGKNTKFNMTASQKAVAVVTPAEAGVQKGLFSWIPAFAGMTEKGSWDFAKLAVLII